MNVWECWCEKEEGAVEIAGDDEIVLSPIKRWQWKLSGSETETRTLCGEKLIKHWLSPEWSILYSRLCRTIRTQKTLRITILKLLTRVHTVFTDISVHAHVKESTNLSLSHRANNYRLKGTYVDPRAPEATQKISLIISSLKKYTFYVSTRLFPCLIFLYDVGHVDSGK